MGNFGGAVFRDTKRKTKFERNENTTARRKTSPKTPVVQAKKVINLKKAMLGVRKLFPSNKSSGTIVVRMKLNNAFTFLSIQ